MRARLRSKREPGRWELAGSNRPIPAPRPLMSHRLTPLRSPVPAPPASADAGCTTPQPATPHPADVPGRHQHRPTGLRPPAAGLPHPPTAPRPGHHDDAGVPRWRTVLHPQARYRSAPHRRERWPAPGTAPRCCPLHAPARHSAAMAAPRPDSQQSICAAAPKPAPMHHSSLPARFPSVALPHNFPAVRHMTSLNIGEY
ncbi:hypothetical protein D3C71_1298100 [compost metagenome]